ncbi:MAG: NAD-dependent epimerase/dehydratase family protein [Alphaproteobacteria bacterium]|nr:NAD-dependent epimerase/dehydratase family protein [Alphaproteobacteria bacterium]
MPRRILITGGNGYVGREVTRLLYREHEVCVADNLRMTGIRFSPDERLRFRFERVDLADAAATKTLIDDFKPAVVIHLAAIHYIPECEAEPGQTVQTNVAGTVNLLSACPENVRVVFASSGAVYKPDDRPHQEATGELEPNDIYGFSKLHGEHYVRYLARQRRLAAVIVRLFNVIGPGETNPHLLPEIVAQLKTGQKVVRLGNLWPRRDYIHIRDAARGFVATALNHDVASGEAVTVNLGTSRPYSVANVITKLREVADIDFALEEDRSRVRRVDRPFLAADNTQIRRLFGWEPKLTIDEALSDLWREPDLSAALLAKYQ